MMQQILYLLLFFCYSFQFSFSADAIVYKVVAQRLSNDPIVSKDKGSYWKYNYNAAIFTKDNQVGLVVRCQNLKNNSVPFEVGPSNLAVSTITFANDGKVSATPTTSNSLTAIPPKEKCGTEDPRVTLNNGIYYLFYTAYDCTKAMLSSAISANPFDANSWIRFSDFDLPTRNWSKSGAALFATADNGLKQDYLFWGDSSFPLGGIGIATGVPGQWGWTETANYLIQTRNTSFDSALVESGPSPLKLNTGDFLFIYNSAQDGFPTIKPKWTLKYNIGYAILDGTDPTKTVQRSDKPILSPELDWEIGNTTDYLTPNVVFLEGLIPDPNGCKNINVTGLLGAEYVANAQCFFGVYGGADSVLGAVEIIVSSNISLAVQTTTTSATTPAVTPAVPAATTSGSPANEGTTTSPNNMPLTSSSPTDTNSVVSSPTTISTPSTTVTGSSESYKSLNFIVGLFVIVIGALLFRIY